MARRVSQACVDVVVGVGEAALNQALSGAAAITNLMT
jgi:hypothetical protein